MALVTSIFALNILRLLLDLVPAFSLGIIVDFAIHRRSIHNLWLVVGGMTGALLIECCTAVTMEWLTAKVKKAVVAEVTERVFAAFQSAPLEQLERETPATLARRIRAIDRVVGYRLDWYAKTAIMPIYVASIMVFVWWKSPLLASCMLGLMACFVSAHWFLNKKLRSVVKEDTKAADLLSKKLHELMGGLRTLRITTRVRHFSEIFLNAQKDLFHASKRRAAITAAIKYSTDVYSRGSVIILLLIGSTLVIHHRLTIGGLIAINLVFRRALTELRATVPRMQRSAQIAYDELLIQQLAERLAPLDASDAQDASVPGFERVRLEHVTFCYAGNHHDALSDVSFEFGRGEFIAIIGGSGDGKSSLLKLLCGLYKPTSGHIRFIGPASSPRVPYGLTTPDDFIFSATVRDNIGLGRPLAEDDVMRAVELSASMDMVRKMGSGLETEVKEQGGNLSTGQQQRLHLARIFAGEAELMLLDEPTSALDQDTEKAVVNSLRKLAGMRTIVAVTHRVAPALVADVVVVMSKGAVIEWGRTSDLLTDPESHFAGWVRTHRLLETRAACA